MKGSKGFSLIELIVVMAIIAILVLLATPWYTNYTTEAKLSQIVNDSKVVENLVETYFIDGNNTLPLNGTTIDIADIKAEVANNKVFTNQGMIVDENNVVGASFEILDSDFVKRGASSKLKGDFIVNSEGRVYYIHDKAVGGTMVSEPVADPDPTLVCVTPESVDMTFDHTIGFFNLGRLTGYSGSGGDIVIPQEFEIGGVCYPVREIGSNVFYQKNVTSVVISDNVEMILSGAFEDNPMTSVIIGESVQFIDQDVFKNNQLTSLVVPDSVQFIGIDAFADNNLTSVVLGNGLMIIDRWAFSGNSISNLVFGNNLLEIRYAAFINNSLSNMVIPDSVVSIECVAFSHNSIGNLSIGSGLDTIGCGAFNDNLLTSLIIPDNITTIEASVFASNNIENLVLGNGLSFIGDDAFEHNSLTSITIPSGVSMGINPISASFTSAYSSGGGGSYTAPTQTGIWTKQ